MPVHSSTQIAALTQVYTNGNWFLVFSDATSIGENDTLASVLGTEIVGADGYTSPNYIYSTPTFDVPSQKTVVSAPTVEYNNGGTTAIQYQALISVCCPAGHTRIVPKQVTQANFDGGTDTITLTGHGYADDDRVQFRVESGTIDSAISLTARYYVFNATANTFQLSVDQVNPLALNGDGATLDAYVIDSSVDTTVGGLIYEVYGLPTTINVGQSQSIGFNTGGDSN